MNRKDIIRMAQETGVTAERVRDLVNFAALVASSEREACAKIAEEESMRGLPDEKPKGVHLKMAVAQIVCGTFIADTIRARGQA
jgi:hypothetical protein